MKVNRLQTFLLFIFFTLLFLGAVRYLFPLLTPFILGFFLMQLINPAVKWVERKTRFPRRLAVSVLLVITLILSALILTIIFSQVYQELRSLLTALPDRIVSLGREVNRLQILLKERWSLPEGIWGGIGFKPENLLEKMGGLLQRILNLLTGLPGFLINLFLSGLAAYWLTLDQKRIYGFILSIFPDSWRPTVIKIYHELILSGFRMLKVQLILGVITGLCAAFLMGVFGFFRPGLIGIIVGILDFLPLIGPAILFLPWAGWMLATGAVKTGFLLLMILGAISGLRQLAEVRFLSRNLGLHPLATIFSVYLGARLFGIYGLFLGPLFFLMVRSFYYGILPLLAAEKRN